MVTMVWEYNSGLHSWEISREHRKKNIWSLARDK